MDATSWLDAMAQYIERGIRGQFTYFQHR